MALLSVELAVEGVRDNDVAKPFASPETDALACESVESVMEGGPAVRPTRKQVTEGRAPGNCPLVLAR